jgi:autotransporter-associated beta strand protein
VLTLTGANGYFGATSIGAGSEIILSGGAYLGYGDYGTNITNNGIFMDTSSASQIVEGVISGTGTLTQAGGGLLTLNGTNTYTGATTISSGQLVLGANASISNTPSISIATASTFDVSAMANFTLSTSNSLSATGTASGSASLNGPASGNVSCGSQPISLTFVPQTFTGDLSHQALTISQGALVLGGNSVKVKNSGSSPLGVGSYTLIEVSGGTISGNATLNGAVTGAGLAPGTVGSLSATNGALSLVVATAPTQPRINSFAVSGGNLILSGTNGPANGTYTVLMTTNVTQPLSSWTPVSTNTFSGTGAFSVTNAISGSKGFFAIEVP